MSLEGFRLIARISPTTVRATPYLSASRPTCASRARTLLAAPAALARTETRGDPGMEGSRRTERTAARPGRARRLAMPGAPVGSRHGTPGSSDTAASGTHPTPPTAGDGAPGAQKAAPRPESPQNTCTEIGSVDFCHIESWPSNSDTTNAYGTQNATDGLQDGLPGACGSAGGTVPVGPGSFVSGQWTPSVAGAGTAGMGGAGGAGGWAAGTWMGVWEFGSGGPAIECAQVGGDGGGGGAGGNAGQGGGGGARKDIRPSRSLRRRQRCS